MKKISEMSLEELQDYAITLEGEKASLIEEKASLNVQIAERDDLNRQLQKRNNELFLRVEQQVPGKADPVEDEKEIESCEDFARNLIIKKEK